jgi:hypothetical protein
MNEQPRIRSTSHAQAMRASLQRSAVVLSCFAAVFLAGCASRGSRPEPISARFYPSGAVFVYQPLNPTTIWVSDPATGNLASDETAADITGRDFKDALLRDLDTETVRISLNRLNQSGSASVAVVKASEAGESYVLTVDYIKYFASNRRLSVKYQRPGGSGQREEASFDGNVPIYSGVGVRILAEFEALKGDVNISGLPALALAASVNAIAGRLTVQTLGVTGPEISALMPIISDISVTSIQSAVQAVSAIKAKLYDQSTVAYPKVVGFEAPADRLEAIPAITEALYGLDLRIYPRVSPNPMKAGERILWIRWFTDADDQRAGSQAQGPAPAAR